MLCITVLVPGVTEFVNVKTDNPDIIVNFGLVIGEKLAEAAASIQGLGLKAKDVCVYVIPFPCAAPTNKITIEAVRRPELTAERASNLAETVGRMMKKLVEVYLPGDGSRLRPGVVVYTNIQDRATGFYES